LFALFLFGCFYSVFVFKFFFVFLALSTG